MKTIYLDCGMGAAGDMLAGALLELLPDRQAFVNAFNRVGIPGVVMEAVPSEKCGVLGTHVRMTVNGRTEGEEPHDHDHDHEQDHHDHEHRGMEEIREIILGLDLEKHVRDHVLAVYEEIAEAESSAHGVPVTEIHFHEVGMMDAIADVTAVAMLIDWIAPDQILASPVNTGSGQIRSAHGILPVPAPATAYLLRGIPCYQGDVEAELTTPTGAALLRHFVKDFRKMPVMKTVAIGYGMGTKDFAAANCVRVFAGLTGEDQEGSVIQLSCNVDDMTAEEMAFAVETLMREGALDAWLTPIVMKKSRLATKIEVLCKEQTRDEIVSLLFKYTTTLGIREEVLKRYELVRSQRYIKTPAGDARIKESMGYGVNRTKIEYDDAAEVARKYRITLAEARELLARGDQ